MPQLAWLAITAWLLSALWAWMGQQPRAVQPVDAPASAFSAQRAQQVLQRLLPDAVPHPVGSAANAAVRQRLMNELQRLGLAPMLRTRLACSGTTCATVHNVLARLPGARADAAVLLTAHYDSVAASPGVSDDGAGVAAVLEAARALQAGPPLPRDVWLLLADGEEAGLLGAEAFIHEPEFARIASVVNLEARGTGGASRLIETGIDNAAIIALLRPLLDRPAATSLDNALYRLLPNSTDFTVYARLGRRGANFAWAQGPARYHTPLDDMAHLDLRSLQQHGDNMLVSARAFALQPANASSTGDAVFFRLFWPCLLGWPVSWNTALLSLALLGWALLPLRQPRGRRPAPLALAARAMTVLLLPVVAAALAWPLQALLRSAGALPAQWTAQAGWLVAAFLLLPLAIAVPIARRLRSADGNGTLTLAALFPFAVLAILLAGSVPAAIHIALLPLLAGVLAGHLVPHRPLLWCLAASVVGAAVLAPYALLLQSAMGNASLYAVSALGMLMLLPLLPALAQPSRSHSALAGLAAAGVVACTAMAWVRPPFDADVPRPMNLLLAGSAQGARLHVDDASSFPAQLMAAGFDQPVAAPLPWSPNRMRPGPQAAAMPGPIIRATTLHTDAAGNRQMRLLVQPQRAVASLTVLLPGSVPGDSVRVFDTPLSHPPADPGQWRSVRLIGIPAAGLRLHFTLPAASQRTVYAYDSTPGLPAAAHAHKAARDAVAVPIHGGDATVGWSRIELP